MPMSKRSRIILVVFIFPLMLFSAFCGGLEWRRSSFQAAYDSIQLGDPRQKVLETMGAPREEEPCFQKANCTSLYYGVLFERWIIYLDANDKVIDKVNHEGSF